MKKNFLWFNFYNLLKINFNNNRKNNKRRKYYDWNL